MEFQHKSVLLSQCLEALAVKPDGIYLDGTLGGAGHSSQIAKRLTTGRLIGVDRDEIALCAARQRLAPYMDRVTLVHANFQDLDRILQDLGIPAVDGILLDLGVSSPQLDDGQRGFSYMEDAPLDMRMSQEGPTARDLVNTLSQQELADIIFRYGEDKSARRIAQGIVQAREEAPIETTAQLAEIIKASVPAAVRRAEGHPARRTFQALRIAVNGELDRLREGLEAGFALLKPGGRLAVITFHSLEDRIVKQQMHDWCQGCVCPKDFPVCVCGRKPQGRLVYKKGLAPSAQEVAENPRARSARLRVIEKLPREQ